MPDDRSCSLDAYENANVPTLGHTYILPDLALLCERTDHGLNEYLRRTSATEARGLRNRRSVGEPSRPSANPTPATADGGAEATAAPNNMRCASGLIGPSPMRAANWSRSAPGDDVSVRASKCCNYVNTDRTPLAQHNGESFPNRSSVGSCETRPRKDIDGFIDNKRHRANGHKPGSEVEPVVGLPLCQETFPSG